MSLGELSAKYESNGDPGTVSSGEGDSGGISYGIYQFASNKGSVQQFVQWLKEQPSPYNQYGIQLESAGDPRLGGAFAAKWEQIGTADREGFRKMQEAYVKPIYFDAGAANLKKWYGLDITQRSEALQSVLWSNSVQHGSGFGAEVFDDAARKGGFNLKDASDRDIIYYIYEVKLTDESWTDGAPSLRPGLYARWRNEREDALAMLEHVSQTRGKPKENISVEAYPQQASINDRQNFSEPLGMGGLHLLDQQIYNRNSSKQELYRVQEGDTLSDLASRRGTSVNKILQVNPQINDPDMIYPGDAIYMPKGNGILLSYFQLPEQQLQEMKNMAYLENQPFKIEDDFGYSNNIMLQIGNLQYKIESYSSNIS